MKNIVRALTVTLALTGFAATTQTSVSTSKSITGKVNTVLVPSCPPNDPNACGIGKH